MSEPVKCWIQHGEVWRGNEAEDTDTPAVAVPINLLERLVEDAVSHADDCDAFGDSPSSTPAERDHITTLIRELREEG